MLLARCGRFCLVCIARHKTQRRRSVDTGHQCRASTPRQFLSQVRCETILRSGNPLVQPVFRHGSQRCEMFGKKTCYCCRQEQDKKGCQVHGSVLELEKPRCRAGKAKTAGYILYAAAGPFSGKEISVSTALEKRNMFLSHERRRKLMPSSWPSYKNHKTNRFKNQADSFQIQRCMPSVRG